MRTVLRPDEVCCFWILAEVFQVFFGWELGFVSGFADQAEEAQGCVFCCAELMPGLGWDVDEVVFADVGYFIAYHALALAAQDQHVVEVFVALQRGMAAGGDFEVAPLGGEGVLAFEQDLAGDVFVGAAVLVGEEVYLFPAEVLEAADVAHGFAAFSTAVRKARALTSGSLE